MSKKKEKRTVLSDEAEKGLLGSIERWRRLATGKRLEGESVGPEQCPLCCLYFEEECKGCPIARHMQRQFCAETPYEKADAMYAEYGLDSMEFRAATRKELEFLKQVLKSYEIPGKGASVEQPKVPTVVRVKKDSLVEWENILAGIWGPAALRPRNDNRARGGEDNADREVARRLRDAAALMQVRLVDHVIVGSGGRHFSFREAGEL